MVGAAEATTNITWFPPDPPRLSFLNTAPEDTRDLPMWETWPTEFTPYNLDGGFRDDVACTGNTGSVAPGAIPGPVDAYPFAVIFGEKCTTPLWTAPNDRIGRVDAGLAAIQSHEIADEFWGGGIIQGRQRVLIDVASDRVTSGAVNPEVALQLLEQAYMADTKGQRGMIHMPIQCLDALAAAYAIRREGSVWLTPCDNLVVADSGYDGSGPAASAGVYMYSTTMVRYRLSPVMYLGSQGGAYTVDALDRDINDLTLRAQRLVLLEWDEQGHFAAQTNLTAPAVGGAS